MPWLTSRDDIRSVVQEYLLCSLLLHDSDVVVCRYWLHCARLAEHIAFAALLQHKRTGACPAAAAEIGALGCAELWRPCALVAEDDPPHVLVGTVEAV